MVQPGGSRPVSARRGMVGVLALQGAFREHMLSFEALGVPTVAVRQPEQMSECAGLVIPGGESTAIALLMERYGFHDALAERRAAGMAVWGTCAGAILMAREVIDAVEGQRTLGLMDVAVRRNAYGRQIDSFEADVHFAHLDGGPFRGVFIRAPWMEAVGGSVEILAEHDGHIVAAREGDMMATTFHPELTGDPRIHRYFAENVVGRT